METHEQSSSHENTSAPGPQQVPLMMHLVSSKRCERRKAA